MDATIKRLQDNLAQVQTWIESAEKSIELDMKQVEFWNNQLKQDTVHLNWCKDAAQEWQNWLNEAIADKDDDFETTRFTAGEVVYSGNPPASDDDEFPF